MEWNPEIAPQATEMNMNDHMGVPCGCMLRKLFQISGIAEAAIWIWVSVPSDAVTVRGGREAPVALMRIVPMATPTAMTIRQIPKIG